MELYILFLMISWIVIGFINVAEEEINELCEFLYKSIINNSKENIEIFKLSTRREEYSEDYIDYSELFRHLRNSIAHGRYEIEYDRALKTHNLDKIRFTFYDYNEDNEEKNKPDFEISLTAAKILKIINGVQARVNRQLDMENKLERIVKTKLEDFMPEMEFDDGDEVELD